MQCAKNDPLADLIEEDDYSGQRTASVPMLRAGTCFTFAMEVAHATAAEVRMFGIGAHVLAHVPASLAFGMTERGAFKFFFRVCARRWPSSK